MDNSLTRTGRTTPCRNNNDQKPKISARLSVKAMVPSATPAACAITVHTVKWLRLQIDRGPFSESPLKWRVAAGRHKITWNGAHKQGEREIYVEPGQVVKLNDRDFQN